MVVTLLTQLLHRVLAVLSTRDGHAVLLVLVDEAGKHDGLVLERKNRINRRRGRRSSRLLGHLVLVYVYLNVAVVAVAFTV